MIDALDIEPLEREAMNRAGLEDFGTGDWREAPVRRRSWDLIPTFSKHAPGYRGAADAVSES